MIFWVLTPFSVEDDYQRFGGNFCLHLEEEKPMMYKTIRTYQTEGTQAGIPVRKLK
jgi:hypothetical protein